MERKDVERLLRNSTSKKAGNKKQPDYRNSKEDSIIDAIDMRHTITKYTDWIERLRTGKIDVGQFFTSVSPDVAIQLLHTALDGESEKTRLAAITDLLDRAGHGKVNKHAIASVDPNQPKEQLLSLIMGLNKKSGTIEIEEDDKDQTQEE